MAVPVWLFKKILHKRSLCHSSSHSAIISISWVKYQNQALRLLWEEGDQKTSTETVHVSVLSRWTKDIFPIQRSTLHQRSSAPNQQQNVCMSPRSGRSQKPQHHYTCLESLAKPRPWLSHSIPHLSSIQCTYANQKSRHQRWHNRRKGRIYSISIRLQRNMPLPITLPHTPSWV